MVEGQLSGELPVFRDLEVEATGIQVFNDGNEYLWVEPCERDATTRMPSSKWSIPLPPHSNRIVWKGEEPALMTIGLVGNNNPYRVVALT
jgi:hypothetical protein